MCNLGQDNDDNFGLIMIHFACESEVSLHHFLVCCMSSFVALALTFHSDIYVFLLTPFSCSSTKCDQILVIFVNQESIHEQILITFPFV